MPARAYKQNSHPDGSPARNLPAMSLLFATQLTAVATVEAEELSRPPGGPSAAPFVVARAVNSSDQPVYDVEFCWRRGSASHGEPNPEPLGILMPGEREEKSRDFPPDTNMAVSGAILRFRDAAGVRWIRRSDGGLVEQR